ncbi:hypothetical protein RIF23_17790 [Lipingzhangella sp. LS1_29]|uniref:Secreted protein with PEP-CTERM sorting signal n=1 Tax=Lipingzhangella rawalii TaxID=2055835 RepID=A0ABU2HBD9_9ACTN|nr:hypothetical protein [Lipingzhangella rawalii]MDS1272145.1 hypothetical protein [Lipingzhangella rawalii]
MSPETILFALADSGVPDESVTPGVLGFLVIFAVGAGLFFLLRSMRQKLVQVREQPPAPVPEHRRPSPDQNP